MSLKFVPAFIVIAAVKLMRTNDPGLVVDRC